MGGEGKRGAWQLLSSVPLQCPRMERGSIFGLPPSVGRWLVVVVVVCGWIGLVGGKIWSGRREKKRSERQGGTRDRGTTYVTCVYKGGRRGTEGDEGTALKSM